MKTSGIELPARSRITSQAGGEALRIQVPARREVRWGPVCVLGFVGITLLMQGILTQRPVWIVIALPFLTMAGLLALWHRRREAVEIAADSKTLTITLWEGEEKASRSCEWSDVATITTADDPRPVLEIQLRNGTVLHGLDGMETGELEWIAEQIKKRRG